MGAASAGLFHEQSPGSAASVELVGVTSQVFLIPDCWPDANTHI